MNKFVLKISLLFLGLFLIRVWSNGGISDQSYPGLVWLEPWQSSFNEQIQSFMPKLPAALLSGMLLGVQGQVPYTLKQQMKSTSTIHLLVVSGQNLSLVASFLSSMLRPLGRIRATWLTLIAIILYSLLTGFGIPVIRAWIMSTLSLVGQLVGRRSTGWWTLCLTAGVMLLFEPSWLISISFQLSFLATAGAMVVSPALLPRLGWLPEMVRNDFAVSLAAQLTTLPIIAYNFQQISLIGIIANCFILWTVSPIMILGAAALAISYFNPFLAQVVALVPNLLLAFFLQIIYFFSDLPFASINLPASSWQLWVIYYLIMVHLIYVQTKAINSHRASRSGGGIFSK